MGKNIGRLAAIAVFLFAQAGLVSAAEIKVYSTIGVKGAIEDLAPMFEKAMRQQAQHYLGSHLGVRQKARRTATCLTC